MSAAAVCSTSACNGWIKSTVRAAVNTQRRFVTPRRRTSNPITTLVMPTYKGRWSTTMSSRHNSNTARNTHDGRATIERSRLAASTVARHQLQQPRTRPLADVTLLFSQQHLTFTVSTPGSYDDHLCHISSSLISWSPMLCTTDFRASDKDKPRITQSSRMLSSHIFCCCAFCLFFFPLTYRLSTQNNVQFTAYTTNLTKVQVFSLHYIIKLFIVA